MDRSNIYVAYTGGTIGMKKRAKGFTNVKNQFEKFIRGSKEYQVWNNNRNIDITFNEYKKLIDSSDIKPRNWNDILMDIRKNYDDYDGFVIVHGTDTLAYTSSMLSFLIKSLRKPIVLTGSQVSIFEPNSDAFNNLFNSFELATGRYGVQEVCIVFNNLILKGCRATKVSSIQFDGFMSPRQKSLGRIDNGIINIDKRYLWTSSRNTFRYADIVLDKIEVVVVKLFPGIDSKFLMSIATDKNVKAIVVEAYGSGNGPASNEFKKALIELQNAEIVVVVLSQPLHGNVVFGSYANSNAFKKFGAISGFDMTTEATVAKLYYLIKQGKSYSDIQSLMGYNMRGEINKRGKLPKIKITN
ncbi:asparaginase domain-containing protein [Aquimarina megaterium]|uniref:asparaginase domain-containing protein n=1 Tax=Aquimarina megaterium TaxID=1443666 RepID=UPI00047163FD|nr:asparaginase domain-containing protein [Aquimarina megaterium]